MGSYRDKYWLVKRYAKCPRMHDDQVVCVGALPQDASDEVHACLSMRD